MGMLLFLASCTEKQKAKNIVKSFVETNIKAGTDYSIGGFGSIDSTRYVTNDAVSLMKSNAKNKSHFKSNTQYGERLQKEQLKYINATIKVNGKDSTYTFYLSNDLSSVVAIK